MATQGGVMPNHWSDDGDLIIEEKTLFRQVGWQSHMGTFFPMGQQAACAGIEYNGYPVPYSPVYIQISIWKDGEGWCD
jgi:hypothetical protein